MEMLIYPTQIILLLFGTYVSLVTCLCSDFSIGQCIPRPGDIVNTLQVPVGTEISTAWGICKSMCGFYGCNYISYDKSTRVCVLMDLDDRSDYHNECNIMAGPANPSLQSCDQSNSGSCDLFLEEDCEYMGGLITLIEDVESPLACQQLMQWFESTAQLFVYNRAERTCEFRDSRIVECQAILGPKDLNYPCQKIL